MKIGPAMLMILAASAGADPVEPQVQPENRSSPEALARAVQAIQARKAQLVGVLPTLIAEAQRRLDDGETGEDMIGPNAELVEAITSSREEIRQITAAVLAFLKKNEADTRSRLVVPATSSEGFPCPKDPAHPRTFARYCSICRARIQKGG